MYIKQQMLSGINISVMYFYVTTYSFRTGLLCIPNIYEDC